MEYLVTIYASIEADSDQEAFNKYCEGEYFVDDHELARWEDGLPVLVDETGLDNY